MVLFPWAKINIFLEVCRKIDMLHLKPCLATDDMPFVAKPRAFLFFFPSQFFSYNLHNQANFWYSYILTFLCYFTTIFDLLPHFFLPKLTNITQLSVSNLS